jgi:hypothetical protein
LGLDKLKSVFNENVGNRVTDFFQNPPDGFTPRMKNSQISPDNINYVEPTQTILSFGPITKAVDFMNQTHGVEVPGFTKNFERIDGNTGPGNTKYLGLTSRFNNNSVLDVNSNDNFFVNFMNATHGTLIQGFDKFSTEYGFLENNDVGSSRYFSGGTSLTDGDLVQPRSIFDDFNKDPKTNFVDFFDSTIPGFDSFGTEYSFGTGLGASKYISADDLVAPRSSYYNTTDKFGNNFNTLGGQFELNKDNKYSTTFRTINTPDLSQLMEVDNKLGILDIFNNSINIDSETKGYIKGEGINLKDSSWFFNSTQQDFIPKLNDNIEFNALGTRSNLGLTSQKLSEGDLKFETLYKDDHTTTDTGYSYPGVDRSKMDQLTGGLFTGGFRSTEPYILDDIQTSSQLSGKKGGPYGFELAAYQSGQDIIRMTKFLGSPAGLLFIARQNALAISPRTVRFDSNIPVLNKRFSIGLPTLTQRFNEFYSPTSTILSAARILRAPVPNAGLIGGVFDRNDPFGPSAFGEDEYTRVVKDTQQQSFNGESAIPDGLANNVLSNIPGANNLKPFTNLLKLPKKGDFFTNLEIGKSDIFDDTKIDESINKSEIKLSAAGFLDGVGKNLVEAFSGIESTNIEAEKNGMPFYFKDLRTDTYVFFRAYLQGITENISPEWNPETYIGRAEPVYSYVKTERDISFNLTLAAQTRTELDKIYQKMNRLTSMCYPQYKTDNLFDGQTGRTRSKPPFTRIRLGEMYGDSGMGLLGFMKSVTYTVADNSTWEHEKGYRVPKIVEVSVNYQVLHDESPGINNDGIPTRFYGIYKQYEAPSVEREFVNV